MTSQTPLPTGTTEIERVGARPRTQVRDAYGALEASCAHTTVLSDPDQGALAAYRWALGYTALGPVTQRSTDDDANGPGTGRLLTERRAAGLLMADPRHRPSARQYARGVHNALDWICAPH